jgi:hypothetical protein
VKLVEELEQKIHEQMEEALELQANARNAVFNFKKDMIYEHPKRYSQQSEDDEDGDQ